MPLAQHITAGAAALAASGGHAGPSGIHRTPLSQGTIGASVQAHSGGIEINTNGRKDVLAAKQPRGCHL